MTTTPNSAPAGTDRAAPRGKPPLSSRILRATWRGLPARRYEAGFEPGLVVPAADGSPLLTDHYFPRAQGDFPTLLVRSPYGRGLPWSPMYGMLFAEQGFHVVLQSCRGTGGSGGRFDLWRNEPADGLAAVAWLREQPWFTGRLGTIGPSYLGYTQWALALDPPPELGAMVVQAGLHDPHALFHSGGALRLENALAVGAGITYQHRGTVPFLRATLRLRRRLRTITGARPLRGAHVSALGEIPWLEGALAQPDAGDPYWDGADLGAAAERLSVPTCLVTGRHDALADQAFEQYGRLRAAGCETSLLVGPWTHTSALQQGWPEVFAESLAWLRAHLCDDSSGLRATRVRVHTGGGGTWCDVDDWPPSRETASWFAAPGGRLDHREAPVPSGRPEGPVPSGEAADSGAAREQAEPVPPGDPTGAAPLAEFRYDPDDPTPSVGGPLLSPAAGARDNGTLEAREDVLTFTGPPLAEPLGLLGPVSARLRLSTDTGHADVFSRLCDVDPRGRSTNVCDGLGQVRTDGPAPAEVTVPMSTAAHRFPAGHRVRWQISGGAHPRYARGTGSGEPVLDATDLLPVRIAVHPGSVLLLPHADAGAAETGGTPGR